MYKTKTTIKDVREKCYKLYKDEYTIISDVYINSKTKIEVKHNKCSNSWMIATHSLFSNKGCPYCRGSRKHTIDTIKKVCYELNGDDYTIISDTYLGNKSRLDIKHNVCGYIYPTTFNTMSSKKSKCPACNGRQRQNIDIIKKRCYELYGDDYEILSDIYINASVKLKIKHNKCKNEWYATTKTFLNQNKGCSKCSMSKGEYKIETFLRNNNISFECQKTFDKCVFKNKLKFDFYLSEQNICIEFDGIQHFEPVEHFGGINFFNTTKKRDIIKNEFCNINNIKLLRISYKDLDKIELILKETFIN